MMIQHRIIALYVVISGLQQLKTEIHIIVSYCHFLVHATHLFILFAGHHQAGSCNTCHIIGYLVAAVVIISVIRKGN